MQGLHLTLRLLRPDALFISDLRTPYRAGTHPLEKTEFERLRDQLNDRASDLLPGNFETIDELFEKSRKYRKVIRRAQERRDRRRYNLLVRAFTAHLPSLNRILDFASYLHLHQRLVHAVRPLFLAATGALVLLFIFAVVARPAKEETKLPPPVVVQVLPEKAKALPSLRPVLFATGSAMVTGEGMAAVAEARDILIANPGTMLLLRAHTDTVAGAGINRKLARRRAEAVCELLINAGGIAASRVFVAELPEQALPRVTTQETAELRNRSVELVLVHHPRPE